MKLALAAFAVACLSFGGTAATAAVRGSNDAAEPAVRVLNADDTVVGKVEEAAPPVPTGTIQTNLAPEDMGVGADHYYKKYETGSCTCAKEAWLQVHKEGQAHLKMVPLIQNPADFDPTTDDDMEIYPKIQREINRLLDFAVCFLHSIDCGCEDAPSSYGNLPVKHFGKYAVSTYQCCCDVNAIRDIIINGIKELSQWETHMDPMTMHTVVNTGLVHKRKQFHVLENIVQNVYKNAREVGAIYVEEYEKCLEAICADDSLFEPALPSTTNLNEYKCGNDGRCQLVCDGKGKTVCGRTKDSYTNCNVDSDCASLGLSSDVNTWKCIPSSNPANQYEGECVETIPEPDSPCP